MPIDTSIYGNIRPIQIDNPLNNYAQIAGIQNAQNQNRLADIQYRQALKAEEDDAATREAISAAGGDYSAARNALMSRGLYKPAMAIDKQNLDTRKTQAEITEKDLAAAGKRYETWSSAMAPLINKPNLSHDDILAVGTQLERAGVIQPGWKADVPMNALQLPDYVKGVAMRAEQGRKAVEMMLPKVQMVDNNGTITPWNTNTMAGPVGALSGAQPVTKVATPGEVLTDTRTRSEGAANRGVTIRGQNMADARAGQTYDAERGLVVDTRSGTAKPVMAGGAPLGGKLSESAKKELQAIDAQANTIDKALESVKAAPKAFGMARGLATMAGTVPEALANSASSDANIQARSFVYNVVSKVINERAGAAQSAQELARLRAFLPAEVDDAEVIKSKLQGFKKYLAEQRKAYETTPTAKPAQAGATQAGAPKAGDVDGGYRFKGGDPADSKNWEKV